MEVGTTTFGVTGNEDYKYEGVTCSMYIVPGPGLSPLYRYWNGTNHLYTLNGTTVIGTTTTGTVGNHNYLCEGIAGYCYSYPAFGTLPLYRYWNGVNHFYTTDGTIIGTTTLGTLGNFGFRCGGIACYVRQ